MVLATPPPRVSVIIVNWNGLAHLAECFASLAAQSFRDFEAILVDNGSTDGSLAFIAREHPWVRVLPLAENCGFAEGNNVGYRAARGAYLVPLNNDTRVDLDWLAELVAVADGLPRVGMVGCRICRYDAPERLDALAVALCPDGMSRGVHRGRRFAELGCAAVEPILLPSACAALYKREMIEEIGFFDADFFAYCEDTDLGLRGRLAGWEAVAATNAIVLHKYSSTGGALSPFKLRLVERNHYWVALKTFPLPQLALVPFWTVERYLHQVGAFLRGNWRRPGVGRGPGPGAWVLIVALLQGMGEALAGSPRMLAKRRQVQATRRLSTTELRRLFRRYRLSFRELFEDDDCGPGS